MVDGNSNGNDDCDADCFEDEDSILRWLQQSNRGPLNYNEATRQQGQQWQLWWWQW